MLTATLTSIANSQYKRMNRAFMLSAEQSRATGRNATLAIINGTTGLLHGCISATATTLRMAWNHKQTTLITAAAAIGFSYQDEIKLELVKAPHLFMANLCEIAPTCSDNEAMSFRVNAALIEAAND